ncbi:MAG: AAA family ATPase, partial [Pseudomonadota bacterium]
MSLSKIESINEIKDFGIFVNYQNKNRKQFAKVNIIYGWNGSGKTTLGKLLACLDSKKIDEDYPDATFNVVINGADYSKQELLDLPVKIRVFNEDYVKQNISFDGTEKTKGIFRSRI